MCKISIIIPIYNTEKHLKRCLDSVINQTYKDIEIICINDGSNDHSLDILKEYQEQDNRIVMLDKQNEGVSSARNDGIMKSTGKYITFVDADDWLELDAIETLYNTLVEKKVDVVRGNYYRNFDYNINGYKGELHNLSNKVYNTDSDDFGDLVIDKLIEGSIPCYTCLLLIKKEVILKTTLFKKDVHLMEDMIFYIELLTKIKSIYFLDKPTYHYFCNENSCTKSSEYYIRNMYNIIKVNSYIKNIIINSKYNSKVRLVYINTIQLNMIFNHIFMLYKSSNYEKTEIAKELDKLFEEEQLQEMLLNSNVSKLPIHLKLPIVLANKRKYKALFAFYKFRIIMSKIKDKITKRKE